MKIYDQKITEYVLATQKSFESINKAFASTDTQEIYCATKYYVEEIYDPYDACYGEGDAEGGTLDMGMIALYYGTTSDPYVHAAIKALADEIGYDYDWLVNKIYARMDKIAKGIDVRALDSKRD